jgi:hypothetical protein
MLPVTWSSIYATNASNPTTVIRCNMVARRADRTQALRYRAGKCPTR